MEATRVRSVAPSKWPVGGAHPRPLSLGDSSKLEVRVAPPTEGSLVLGREDPVQPSALVREAPRGPDEQGCETPNSNLTWSRERLKSTAKSYGSSVKLVTFQSTSAASTLY